jgi:hypothetical protein
MCRCVLTSITKEAAEIEGIYLLEWGTEPIRRQNALQVD